MSRQNQVKFLFVFSLIALTLYSCGGMKMSGAQKAGKYFESFYTGENGVQYFIKPLIFESTTSKEFLEIDALFRINDNPLDSATFNVSINSNEVIERNSDLILHLKGETYKASYSELFYQERENKFVLTRNSYKTESEIAYDYVKQPIDSVEIKSNGVSLIFIPSKKTKKALGYVSDKLIF